MGLQLLTHQRNTGNGPAGSRELKKMETNKYHPMFLEIHCPDEQEDLKLWFWFMKSRRALALASSSCFRRAFSPKTRASLQCVVPTALLSPIPCSTQCTAVPIQAQQSAGSLLCCVSAAGGSRSRPRPAAPPCPAAPGDGLGWSAAIDHGQVVLQVTTVIIIILIALFDHTDRAPNVPIIRGTPCEHL